MHPVTTATMKALACYCLSGPRPGLERCFSIQSKPPASWVVVDKKIERKQYLTVNRILRVNSHWIQPQCSESFIGRVNHMPTVSITCEVGGSFPSKTIPRAIGNSLPVAESPAVLRNTTLLLRHNTGGELPVPPMYNMYVVHTVIPAFAGMTVWGDAMMDRGDGMTIEANTVGSTAGCWRPLLMRRVLPPVILIILFLNIQLPPC